MAQILAVARRGIRRGCTAPARRGTLDGFVFSRCTMDFSSQTRDSVSGLWDSQIVPQLVDYIKIPNKSPMFDKDWAKHGYMDQAVALMEAWAKSQPVKG